ncbi:DUF2777 family protein [Sinobaca sp. H24]|uniref:DUF2777 family protein n=1 Tax=Sinobaca sp. H24 TaxID=2923376 RepID=UPI00207A16E8|nr:DUF2777 family protein [Sinobaca sp. H24]
MNRADAKQQQGRTVLIDLGNEGTFFATLHSIVTPPQQVWNGEVTITGIFTLPVFSKIDTLLDKPGKNMQVNGQKIFPVSPDRQHVSFSVTLSEAIEDKKAQITERSRQNSLEMKQYNDILRQLSPKDASLHPPVDDVHYIYYKIEKSKDVIYLTEPKMGDVLELANCPFQLEAADPQQGWINVNHIKGFRFANESGDVLTLRNHDWVRIHPEQFEPYTILLNELDKTSRQGLKQALVHFSLTDSDLLECHNRLLYELLQSSPEATLKGVNFISYQRNGLTVIIQHHYVRHIHNKETDYVYDRFECTADNGERKIYMYTNNAYTKNEKTDQ